MVSSNRLTVRAREPLTPDAFLVEFGVPEALRAAYRYRAGQHVAVETTFDGVRERRSYSLCLPPHEAGLDEAGAGAEGEARLAIGVKVLPGGRFSGYVRDQLAVGDALTVLTPTGRFTARATADGSQTQGAGTGAIPVRYGVVAAGSGITPIMSILGDRLRTGMAQFRMLLGNRGASQVMFADRLAGWQRAHPEQVDLRHVWSQETSPDGRAPGRLTVAEVHDWVDAQHGDGVTEWFLCGPQALVEVARQRLGELGVGRRMVHTELFHT